MTTRMRCHCGFQGLHQDRDIYFVSVTNLHNSTRSIASPITYYNDLFRTFNDHYCNRCLQITAQEQSLFYEIGPQNRYICMVIHNVFLMENQFKNLQIGQVNPDEIILPSINNQPNPRYKLNTAVIRQGNNRNNGHYLVWTRNINNTKWIRISDSSAICYNNLIKNLRDAYLLFLERID